MPATSSLRADCGNCFGLCCVVPAFAASADFAITKPAGQACPNLGEDSRCGIHDKLRTKGFTGCTVYDCFGAGQKVSQVTFDGDDWRKTPKTAKSMFAVFPVMRDLHELLYYLTEAAALPTSAPIHANLTGMIDRTEGMTLEKPEVIRKLAVHEHRGAVNGLLLRASELARAEVPGKKKDRRGADLIGAKLKGANLRGALLRGAYLIGADLRDADLRRADVIGADLRNADIRGTDFRDALFLIQSQLDAAKGDATTKLPESLSHPAHW
ncbi:pentapeptide repeat-containing protein [Amycolatopsis sp. NPDC051071]|uniref:pentapeptide repeat-containing protein n=1 Tax=Amycolatopsis sp. NPDC051071 TaxID=3154637 RepID=UPI00342C5812